MRTFEVIIRGDHFARELQERATSWPIAIRRAARRAKVEYRAEDWIHVWVRVVK